ncbi:GNAT family N-acetyltransferase [Halorussus vallis]|uniref:GNAT family N-acetyltransferase n=2 Tax=Halorussus TaxID=1070314 RepID=UPI0020A2043C|nr:GNAT family N-acetyltransferase [Halorussus vallis]USZ76130.1 GNAT family N-acetyltransferase [Halorussus vallis]
MNYRPLPEDRYDQFREYLNYAFNPESGPEVDDEDWDPAEQPGAMRGLFDGEDLLCVCRHYWFRTRVRGRWTEMPGLSAVASPPEHRRKGHVAAMLAESLAEYHDRGDFLTALWAFEHPFYAKYGWGLTTKYVSYECSPDVLDFARERVDDDAERAGEFRQVDADDHEELDAVLAADNEPYELALDRTEKWWRKRVFESWRKDPYAYAWERDGEIRGYLVYTVEKEGDGKQLAVRELAAVDDEAYRHCLRFLANHDSQVETVRIYGPERTDLFDRVRDPADVDCEVKPGPMVRLVDVPAAFEALDYGGADGDANVVRVSGEFTLAVTDPLAEWNDRTFRVAIDDGRATCDPADEISVADADARVGVGTLSQVYVGYHSVADAERLGDLEVRDAAVRETLTAMFPPRDVFLREGF